MELYTRTLISPLILRYSWISQVSAYLIIIALLVIAIDPILINSELHEHDIEHLSLSTRSEVSCGSRAVFSIVVSDTNVAYAIIAPSAYVSALSGLQKWKTDKGVPAKIYGLEDIYNSYTGKDNAEQIHKFLKELESTSEDLEWVLLVGDGDILPVRKLFTLGATHGLDYEYYSDYYYAGLDSTWDKNGNGRYGEDGEEDWGANVYVGRLPAGSVADVEVMVNKILTYEKNPPDGA